MKLIDLSENNNFIYTDIFHIINASTSKFKIPYMVVGATARDLVFIHGFNIKTERATYDLDFAIRVLDWDDFHKIKYDLLTSKEISETKITHRLIYKNEIPIDIIPFGQIADSENNISWPPENETVFNILGFEEAFENTIVIKLRNDPELKINVVDLKSLTLLKLISFFDRTGLNREKDAGDLAYIFDNYLEAGNSERISGDESHILDEEEINYYSAGARLLGMDISKIIKLETSNKLLELLNKEIEREVSDLAVFMVSAGDKHVYEKRINQLNALRKGLQE